MRGTAGPHAEEIEGLDVDRLRPGLAASLAGSVAMGLALWGWLSTTRGSSVWLVGLGGVAVGAGIYWLIALLLRAPEASRLPGLLFRRPSDAP